MPFKNMMERSFLSVTTFFIKEVADCIIEIDNGSMRTYPGGLEYYLDKKGQLKDALEEKKRQEKIEEKKKKEKNRIEKEQQESNPLLDELHAKHQDAKKRLAQIRNEIKKLEEEKKELDLESYAKSRHLSKSFDRADSEMLKEYGRRLKEIQSRFRIIESTIKQLEEERERIHKA